MLTCDLTGATRSHCRPYFLARRLVAGLLAYDLLPLPVLPQVGAVLADSVLSGEPRSHESTAHRQLKVWARVLALALDPEAALVGDRPLGGQRRGGRPDLRATTRYGVLAVEAGATDGRSITRHLEADAVYAIVMPFAVLSAADPAAFVFRSPSTQPLTPPPPAAYSAAWTALAHHSALPPLGALACPPSPSPTSSPCPHS